MALTKEHFEYIDESILDTFEATGARVITKELRKVLTYPYLKQKKLNSPITKLFMEAINVYLNK